MADRERFDVDTVVRTYDPATGDTYGTLGFSTQTYALAANAGKMVAYNLADSTIHIYTLHDGAPAS